MATLAAVDELSDDEKTLALSPSAGEREAAKRLAKAEDGGRKLIPEPLSLQRPRTRPNQK